VINAMAISHVSTDIARAPRVNLAVRRDIIYLL
jgi:hypothetical protein